LFDRPCRGYVDRVRGHFEIGSSRLNRRTDSTRPMRAWPVLLALCACQQSAALANPLASTASASIGAKDVAPVARAVITASTAHDPTSFTQGLAFWRGRLFEGTGLHGHSLSFTNWILGAARSCVVSPFPIRCSVKESRYSKASSTFRRTSRRRGKVFSNTWSALSTRGQREVGLICFSGGHAQRRRRATACRGRRAACSV
jgi:hypothetical protein